MSGELLLGLDIGTQSSKGVLARPDGELVARAERPHRLSLPRPGWAEHDAEAAWWGDVLALLDELLDGDGDAVAALCVSGIGPCVLAADAAGAPLRPAILYGIDTRATSEIAELTDRYGGDAILERCGSPLTSQAVGPKLAWLRRHEPAVWARMERWFMASSFVVQRLTGEYVLDHHSASQSDPLYDISATRFADDWAAEVAPGLALPRLLWPGEVAGEVSGAAAAATGLAAGTPVCAGTIDAWAEAVSVGVRRPGEVMMMYGSTMFLVQMLAHPAADARLWGTLGVEPGTHCLAAGMATLGTLAEWLRQLCGAPPYEELTAEARALPAGAEGLLALPYFAGERTPLFDPAARGLVCGLTLRHGRGHIYRALLEATAYGVRHNLEALEEAGGASRRLVAVGGGTRGDLWTQIVSDVTGRPQDLPQETLGAAYGDAWLAAVAVGLTPAERDWTQIGAVVEPAEANAARYDELYGHFRALYGATAEVSHALAELQDVPAAS